MKLLEKIHKLELAPAMGKSYANITNMVERVVNNNEKFILAAITLNLCSQTEDDIKTRYPDIRVCRVTSDTKTGGLPIGSRLKLILASGRWDIVIITHEGLKGNLYGVDCSGWNLVIDEVFNPVKVSSFSCQIEDDPVINFIEKVKDGVNENETIYKLRRGARIKVEDKITFATNNDTHYDSKAIHIWEALLEGDYIQCKYDSVTDLYRYSFLSIINPHKLMATFNSVLVLSANATTTLFGVVYNRVYNVEFVACDYISVLRDKYPSPDRINIHYLLKDVNISKWVMDKYDNTTGESLFKVMWDTSVDKILPKDCNFIYAVNKDRFDDIPPNNGLLLSISSHGLNQYSSYTNALAIFACNPRPYDVELFKSYEECKGLPENTILDAFITTSYLESVFQLVTRSAVRDFDNIKPVNIVVPDKRCSDYLSEGWFKGATVHHNNTITYTPPPIGRPQSFNKIYNLNNSESGKFYRWKKKNGYDNLSPSNKEDCLIVEDFISTIRKQKGN